MREPMFALLEIEKESGIRNLLKNNIARTFFLNLDFHSPNFLANTEYGTTDRLADNTNDFSFFLAILDFS